MYKRQTQGKGEHSDVSAAAVAAATGSDGHACDVTTQLSYSDVIHEGRKVIVEVTQESELWTQRDGSRGESLSYDPNYQLNYSDVIHKGEESARG